MYQVVGRKELNGKVVQMDVLAPAVALHAQAGQFVILRTDETGERIPLTVAAADIKNGTVRIIFQRVGVTTEKLSRIPERDFICDFAGPLGRATETDGIKKAVVVCGGLGSAISYPIAKKLKSQGADVTVIAGFRNAEAVILEEDFRNISDNFILMTDDGSAGQKGFVTAALETLLEKETFDRCFTVGPLPMMKFVSQLTKKYDLNTVVSMNPIMIDGTGMCGGCRLTVGGEMKFACVDGPEFDGHKVDFDAAIQTLRRFQSDESERFEHFCNLLGAKLKK